MSFEKFFQTVSYTTVFCGYLSLWVSGTFGLVATGLFLGVIAAAWRLEGSRWQISEKLGTALIVLALPGFYLASRSPIFATSGSDTWIAGLLARMILTLSAVKLLQRKSDRDWMFLYLMAFFEVLLAAGLSISALYLGSFLLFLLVMVCAIIAFEIRRTSRSVDNRIAGFVPKAKTLISTAKTGLTVRRLPTTALALIIGIIVVALPLFFMLPRVGGAGIGGSQNGVSTYSGFSDTVRLGGIGQIQQNDEVVMRIKLEGNADYGSGLYFRGVAFDTFDNRSWRRMKAGREPFVKVGGDPIVLDSATGRENLVIQSIYLEPLDTPILFGLPRMVAVQGNFPALFKDSYGAVTYSPSLQRTSYRVVSDRSLPSVVELQADNRPYPVGIENYRSLPDGLDARIAELARTVVGDIPGRYDKALAIEAYLQNNLGYTLEQKAGGREPLADFLFNVREGHCEYFATAMAVMLRTQGIAARIVNGFHGGEYNETADVVVVRQRHAHAWVEVLFPGEDVWVPFDPTPAAGQRGGSVATGFTAAISRYLEALETFWVQYFVAFDNQEQRSLIRSVRDGFVDYQAVLAGYLGVTRDAAAEWFAEVRGEKGFEASRSAIISGLLYLTVAVIAIVLALWLYRRTKNLALWRTLWNTLFAKRSASIVEFYGRMQELLRQRGHVRLAHQTPLEFAFTVGIPEVASITERYHSVRFGEHTLSRVEEDEIEHWLMRLNGSDVIS